MFEELLKILLPLKLIHSTKFGWYHNQRKLSLHTNSIAFLNFAIGVLELELSLHYRRIYEVPHRNVVAITLSKITLCHF